MDENSVFRPRRVMVLDVSSSNDQRKQTKRRKKKNKKKSSSQHPHTSNQEHSELCEPIPLELKKVIEAATMYGKQTYALGAKQAASTLDRIAGSLRILACDNAEIDKSRQILELINLAERESANLEKLFMNAYDCVGE